MKINFIALLIVLVFFSACSGGDGGGGQATGTSTRTKTPDSISTLPCESDSNAESGEKRLSCTDNTHAFYTLSTNSLCRVDHLSGIAVSTCMGTGSTLSPRSCARGGSRVRCPEVSFSCEVNSLSTLDNWVLSCDDNIAVSMDISNRELCRIDLTDETGFCLDDEDMLNQLPTVWTGYAQSFVEIGGSVTLNTPLYRSDGAIFLYSATPSNVCSVHPQTGLLSIEGFGDCYISLTVSEGKNLKVLEKKVSGRLVQDTSWSGYETNSMDMGTTPPALSSPQYAPNGARYRYASESTDICIVNPDNGAITALMEAGDCAITMTSSATNYADRSISFTLRVNPLNFPDLTWTNPYGSGPFNVLTSLSAPSSAALTGQGGLNVILENYRSTTPTVCLVDETTGVPTLLLNGDCIIEVTASATGYVSQTLSTTLTVSFAAMTLSWTSPIPSLGRDDRVQPNAPSGIPGAATVSMTYNSETPTICSVDSRTGEIRGMANGDCTARLTVTFPGYEPGIVDLDITIDKPQLTTEWKGYSSSQVSFGGVAPTLIPPTNPLGASFTYSSLTESVCTVGSDGTLTLVDAGDCKIRLISSVNDYGDKLFEFDLGVLPLRFPLLGWGDLYGDGPFNLKSTGLTPILANLENVPIGTSITVSDVESLTTDICEVDESGGLTLLRDGTCRLEATVSAVGYTDKDISGSLQVGFADIDDLVWTGYNDSNNTINFGDQAPVLEAPSLTTLTPYTLSYSSEDSSICTVDEEEGTLTIIDHGRCVITLTASALGYNDATETSTQTINPLTMARITWSTYRPNDVGIGQTVEATEPTGIPDGAIMTYSSESPACTVDETTGKVRGQSEGTCRVNLTVTKQGYREVTRTNNVSVKDAQNIKWAGYSANAMVFEETEPTLISPTNLNGATAIFSSLTTRICRVNSTGGLTILDQGLCTIKLSAIRANYGTQVITFDLNISPKIMNDFRWDGYDTGTVTFPTSPNLLAPTGGPNDATLSYISQTENVCTVNRTNGRLRIINDGLCTVKVTARATGYESASKEANIEISALPMSFRWRGYYSETVAFGSTPPILREPTGSPSRTRFRYSSIPSTVCVVDSRSGTLTLSGSGTCTITATGSAPGYADESNTFDLTVTPRMIASLSWAGYSSRAVDFGDTTATPVRPRGVPRKVTFRYVSVTPNICTVDSTTGLINPLNNGSCTITMTASAPNYSDATKTFTLTINPIDLNTIIWNGYSPNSINFGDTIPTYIAPIGGLANTSFNYMSSDETICTVDRMTGRLTSILDHGTCSIVQTASTPGYNDNIIIANVTVIPLTLPEVIWDGYDNTSATFPNAPSLIPPTGVVPSASLSYASSDENICRVNSTSGVLTLVDDGVCEISLRVFQVGYSDIVKSFSFTVEAIDMDTLAYTGYPSHMLIKGPFIYPNSFTGEPSGVRYHYSTSTPNICSVEKDGDLWGRDLGTCSVSVTAYAPGYNDKTLPTVDITVTRGGLATGVHRSCTLLSDGQIKCWGDGTNGAIGQENTDNLGDETDEMGTHLPSVNLGATLRAKFMAMANNASDSDGHACAILDDGQVKCWGTGGSGELGQGSTNNIGDDEGEMGDSLAYTMLGTGRTAKILSLGMGFSCALLDDNTVKCWGKNSEGQLGQNHTDNRGDDAGEMGDTLPIVNLGMNRTAKDIGLGLNHVCALLDNNKVKCWGDNSNGQLGQGNTDNIGDNTEEMDGLGAVDLGVGRTAKRVVAGQNYTCAILDNNDLACWGSNVNNRLGINYDLDNPGVGDEIDEMGGNLTATHLVSEDAIYVDLGLDSTCVIRKSGVLYCWGQNDFGQLGLESSDVEGSSTTQIADVQVDLGSNRNAKIVQLGSQHVCALLDNNDIKCWGRNNAGQLGQEDTTTRGNDSNEMGDNIAAVDLVPDTIGLVWSGYASSNITYGDNAPTLNVPTGYPNGATLSYSTTTTDVCSVIAGTGALSILGSGTCRVVLTVNASGYRNGVRTFNLTVNKALMSNLVWTGYSSSSFVYGETPLTPSAPSGYPQGTGLIYSTTTTDVCTVNSSTGDVTPVNTGICTITLTASARNYEDKVVNNSITFTPATMTNLAWSDGLPTTVLRRGPFVDLDSFVGAPTGVSYRYSTTTSSNCSINSDGEVWGLEIGVCRVSVTAQATGYSDKTMTRDVNVTRGNIALGENAVCALLSDGQIKCWGQGSWGSLGRGDRNHIGDNSNEMGVHLASVDLGTGLKAKLVVGASKSGGITGHFCAILDNSKVKCWGYNESGQLGLEHNNNIGDNSGEMGDQLSYVDLGTNRTAKTLSLGSSFSCAILNNNKIKCWGDNGYGVLGLNDRNVRGDQSGEMGDSLPYVNLGSGRTAKDIEVGYYHVCALLDNNTVKCWGYNNHGQLGQGHTNNIGDDSGEMGRLDPVDIGTNRTAKRVSAGGDHTCTILDNNDLVCWGSNRYSELGVDHTSYKVGGKPNEMGDNLSSTHLVSQDANYVSLGPNSTCVIKKNGVLYCWGNNDSGRLGLGDSTSKGSSTTRSEDIDVGLGSNRKARMVSFGNRHTCALLDNDEIKCWGYNAYGQLGQGHTRSLGDNANEMGDNLAAVDLVPDMIDLVWTGYSSSSFSYNDAPPSLNEPTKAPDGATFAYSTTTTDVCTVSLNGTLTMVSNGTCTVTLTTSAAGYRDGIRTFDIAVTGIPARMSALFWSGYHSNSISFAKTTPGLLNPTGAPVGASFAYTSQTTNVCTVTNEGVLTPVRDGTCTIRLTASADDYFNKTIDRNITIYKSVMNLYWFDFSNNNTATFPNAPALPVLSGAPTGASIVYSSPTTEVCTVTSSGVLTLLKDGYCKIRLTASAIGYTTKTISKNISINPGTTSNFTWSGYTGNNTTTFPNVPSLVPPTGVADNVRIAYSTTSSTVCWVEGSTGALVLLGTGNCVVTASAIGYRNATVTATVVVKGSPPINQATMNLAWSGYSSNTATFPNAPTLVAPTGFPSGAFLIYSSKTASACKVNSSSGALTFLRAGRTCTIKLTALATGYHKKTISQSITIHVGTISNFAWIGYVGYRGTNWATTSSYPDLIYPTGVVDGATITYSTPSKKLSYPCSVNSSTGALHVRGGTGSCEVTVTVQALGYSDVTATITMRITLN